MKRKRKAELLVSSSTNEKLPAQQKNQDCKQATKMESNPLATVPIRSTRLVTGNKMKEKALAGYQLKFSPDSDHPIVTTKKGEPTKHILIPSQRKIIKSSTMKPETTKSYSIDIPNFYNILVPVIVEMREILSSQDLSSLTCINKNINKVLPEIIRLLKIDWRPLLEPRLNYQDQTKIDPHRVDMATSLLIISGLDPGKVVRILGGEYTGSWRNVAMALAIESSFGILS